MAEESTQLRHMDDYLKELIVRYWDQAIQYSIQGNLKKSFLAFKGLFHIIEPYDFSTKPYLTDLTNALQNHLDTLQGRPLTEADQIQYHQKAMSLRELVNIYQSELPKAYKELNLWMQTTVKYSDAEAQLSMQNFGSDLSMFEKYKKELTKNLSLEQAFELMSRNDILKLFGRFKMQNV